MKKGVSGARLTDERMLGIEPCLNFNENEKKLFPFDPQ